jgi:CheY-like chemotaxis protein
MQSDRDQSNLVGMDGFITKPVKLQEIADTIRRLFAPVAPGSPPA